MTISNDSLPYKVDIWKIDSGFKEWYLLSSTHFQNEATAKDFFEDKVKGQDRFLTLDVFSIIDKTANENSVHYIYALNGREDHPSQMFIEITQALLN